ncbi:D-arabinitol 2-dehydrogenase [ribulose-forming] [Verticillium dahliae VDG1]|nr:D-arabinitol 2-dehydrogenase [ribulose-forming] [Verticillium dahliae VDG1]
MPASPVQENPTLRELPDDPTMTALVTTTHYLNPRASSSHLSVTPPSRSSISSLNRDPCSIPLPPSRAVTPTPPDLISNTTHAGSSYSSSSIAPEDWPRTPVDCPPANYPQAKAPALKLCGSKKAKRWLDKTVDGTQGRLNSAGRYPRAEDIDEGVVGRPKLPARPVVAPAEAGALVLAREPEVEFPAVGLAPLVVKEKKKHKKSN